MGREATRGRGRQTAPRRVIKSRQRRRTSRATIGAIQSWHKHQPVSESVYIFTLSRQSGSESDEMVVNSV